MTFRTTANFEILDNTGAKYSSEVEITTFAGDNLMQALKAKIMQVYRVGVEQILSLGNISSSKIS